MYPRHSNYFTYKSLGSGILRFNRGTKHCRASHQTRPISMPVPSPLVFEDGDRKQGALLCPKGFSSMRCAHSVTSNSLGFIPWLDPEKSIIHIHSTSRLWIIKKYWGRSLGSCACCVLYVEHKLTMRMCLIARTNRAHISRGLPLPLHICRAERFASKLTDRGHTHTVTTVPMAAACRPD